jgi:DNA-binding LacI/PurR family transcriptional regulator
MTDRKRRSTPPTIRDVAAYAGVSPATVSRVLNNYPFMRPEVRVKVLAGVAELGYERNRVAQRLRASRSFVVGIVVTDVTNPFLNSIMATIEAVFSEHGYSVLMSNTGSDPQKELNYLSMMESEGVAGIAIAPTSENVNRVAELAESGIPIVVIDRRTTHAPLDCVLSDNLGGAQLAVEHLIALGHRQIGHVGGPIQVTSGRERLEGYRLAMERAGLTVEPGWIRIGDHKYEGGYQNTVALLDDHPELTALFIENNMMSLGALTALHDQRVAIPNHLSIVGFDDLPWYSVLNPPLTVIAQATSAIGSRAASLLLERIERPSLPARTDVLPTTLIVRGSSAPVPMAIDPAKGGHGTKHSSTNIRLLE